MNSMRHTQHHSFSADNLHSNAERCRNEKLVTVNVRRLIEGMLARYSSDFFVFRELIQNADDAKASSFSVEIKCDAPSSSSSEEIDFHNCVITEIRTVNDGLVFSETDWKRVAIIADGNTDTTSVGRFGVGFFSVFSYTEKPIIISGNEYMTFAWRSDNSLATSRQMLPIEQQSETTSTILKMQEKHVLRIKSTLDNNQKGNTDVPTINLAELKTYFAKVLSFTRHIVNLVIKINRLTVFQVGKRKMKIPSSENTWIFRPQPSIGNMLLLDNFSVTRQILNIANGPSITLGHVAVEARLNIDEQFHNRIRRILNKSLPSIVQIQLLFMPPDAINHQQQLQSSAADKDLNFQIFNSILPLRFVDKEIVPAGLIFIGLGTHQSTGIGMHVCSHLIPTVERENLDLQDLYIGKWNEELLTSIGQIARCIYDQIITHSSHCTSYNAVMAPYSFQRSTPDKEVGTIILNGFFASKKQILVPVRQLPSDSHLSLISSTEAYLADSKYIQSFLSFPLIPFELTKNRFFITLKERRLINYVDKSIIKKQLASSILSPSESIELLNWICSNEIDDQRYIKGVLSKLRFRDTGNSSVISFEQLSLYDASHISSVLPLPVNVLSMDIARHFSQDQLQNKLFLSPCTFKDLVDFYLHKNQHYLFHHPETAVCLLSQFSKHWNQFSENQCTKIKTILSTNQCIPTTQHMQFPKDSYIPSRMLKSGLPTITLNLVPYKAIERQTNDSHLDDNLVSIEFLKQIGCRMLHIPSLIESSGNLQAMNYQSMEALIENLIQERKNMTDADFNALKQSKFLAGTTLESMEKTVQTYIPKDLHFSFVAEKLNWSNLLIIDWKDIDQHSSAYAFLKELGVREVPDLYNLINQIVDEHNNMKLRPKRRRNNYKIPISLRFLAENFQKHYSTLWHTSNIQQPFLPSSFSTKNTGIDVILSAPDRVFTDPNPLCATLLPEVVTLFKSHLNILLLGIKTQPTVIQAFDILMERKNELLMYEWTCNIFAYLNELNGLNREFKECLFKIPFILVQGTEALMKPSEVFIHSDHNTKTSSFEIIDTSGLIDYVNFGPKANSFLLSIGVRDFPSASMLAELLIDRQANYFANLTDDDEAYKVKLNVYMKCLVQLAIDANCTSELQNEPIQKRLQNEPWCLGVRRSTQRENDLIKDECRILKPTEIYLNDDNQCARSSHNPWCSNEPMLNKLYQQFGAKWLSDCVSRRLVKKGKAKSTDRSKELHTLIQTRLNMLFVNNRGEKLPDLDEQRVERLRSHLSVYEADKIQCQLKFQEKTITLNLDNGSSCVLTQETDKAMLYFRKDLLNFDFLHIASELARFVFKKPPDNEIHTISFKLSSSLEILNQHGVPVDQLMADKQLNEMTFTGSTPYMRPSSPPAKPSSQKQNILRGVLGAIAFPFMKIARFGGKKNTDIPLQVDPLINIPKYDRNEETRRITETSYVESIHEPFDEHMSLKEDNHQERPSKRVAKKHRVPVKVGLVENFKPNEMEVTERIRCVLDSRPYLDPIMTGQKHIEKEICIPCIEKPPVDMICIDDRRVPIRLYTERQISVTDEMIRHAQQFTWVLINLAADVFEIPSNTIHLFRDINGNSIAFNCNRALFFNLRYFEQVYADNLRIYLRKLKAENDIVYRIVNFYFIVTCHELTHNIHSMHDLNFLRTLEQVIVEFMPRKESFLAQFSFDNYMSYTT